MMNDSSRIVIAIAGQPDAAGNVYDLDMLREMAAADPTGRYVVEGDRLILLLHRLPSADAPTPPSVSAESAPAPALAAGDLPPASEPAPLTPTSVLSLTQMHVIELALISLKDNHNAIAKSAVQSISGKTLDEKRRILDVFYRHINEVVFVIQLAATGQRISDVTRALRGKPIDVPAAVEQLGELPAAEPAVQGQG